MNDNGKNIDRLGHVVYAQALADNILKVEPPVTFGLFARWGSGKSFLIRHIQSMLFGFSVIISWTQTGCFIFEV